MDTATLAAHRIAAALNTIGEHYDAMDDDCKAILAIAFQLNSPHFASSIGVLARALEIKRPYEPATEGQKQTLWEIQLDCCSDLSRRDITEMACPDNELDWRLMADEHIDSLETEIADETMSEEWRSEYAAQLKAFKEA